MKRFYLAFICSAIAISAYSQTESLPAEVAQACYGELRADMTRSVCRFCNVTDTTILQSIESYSLDKFLSKRNEVLRKVIPDNVKLIGSDILELHRQICDIKRSYESNLIREYPDSAVSIIAEFRKYDALIADLTIECLVFNRDSLQSKHGYATSYPQGRFYFEDGAVKCRSTEENADGMGPDSQKTKQGELLYILLCCVLFLIILLGIFFKRHFDRYKGFFADIFERTVKKERTVPRDMSDESSGVDEQSEAFHENAQNADVDKKDKDTKSSVTPVTPEKNFTPLQNKSEKYAVETDSWIIVGASVIGRGHIDSNMPCQDSNAYADLGNGWGIAICSDGAGSAKYSHVGSKIVTQRAQTHFERLIKKSSWYQNNMLPDDMTWSKVAFKALKATRDDMQKVSEKNQTDLASLAATVIVVIHAPMGLLVAHIGDGRAGYQDNKTGTWHSLITPHKGEEANQTIFITSDFWNIPFYEMSGVIVPETRVIREDVKSFVLMSDGCEHASWNCNLYDSEKGIYYDPNTPHEAFFNPLTETLKEHKKNSLPFDERSEKWYAYLHQGNKSFIRETDDKTMTLGTKFK